MGIRDLFDLFTRGMINKVAAPVKADRKVFSGMWQMPAEPRWQEYDTGRKDRDGKRIAGVRPVWRMKYVGDRSIHKPHQGAAECARRRERMGKA